MTSEVEKLNESFRRGEQDEGEVPSWLNHKPALASLWGKGWGVASGLFDLVGFVCLLNNKHTQSAPPLGLRLLATSAAFARQ